MKIICSHRLIRYAIAFVLFLAFAGGTFFVFRQFFSSAFQSAYGTGSLFSLLENANDHRRIETLTVLKEQFLQEKKDFLEINLSAMRVRVWREGSLKKEVPIALAGDPQGWGGTAAGLYSVRSKQEVKYSSIANVYMPWAVHFYGKYFIHGEPYLANGEKRETDVTGGCIQLLNEDAEAIFKEAEQGMPVLMIDKENDGAEFPRRNVTKFPNVSAVSYLVADLDSGYVFAERNAEMPRPIASLTKLMETLVVSENTDLRSAITAQPYMLEPYGSTQGLTAGKRFRIVELMVPALTESSNDAAQVLSYFLGNSTTLALMNQKAKAIQMADTIFVDAHGFSEHNVSTAEDLFRLARVIANTRPTILDMSANKEVRSFGNVSFQNLANKNIFTDDPAFIGGKTGFIKASNYNGVFMFRLRGQSGEERNVAIIELGAESWLEGDHSLKRDTELILHWLKENFFL